MSVSIDREAKTHAEELVKSVKAFEGTWDESFRLAVARNLWCKWMAAERDEELATAVANKLNIEFDFPKDEPLSVEWYEAESDSRRQDLILANDAQAAEIEDAKAREEAANEAKKSAAAAVAEGNTRMRHLARELLKPYVFQLPLAPSKQRELPLADGEEWRTVLLADVLAGDVALKSVVAEKLGNVKLGEYVELAKRFGVGDRPKKLTRKQWDKVESLVQEWHAKQAESKGDTA